MPTEKRSDLLEKAFKELSWSKLIRACDQGRDTGELQATVANSKAITAQV